MKTNYLLMSLILITLISACKKDTETTPSFSSTSGSNDFGQLKVGNYWVYQVYTIDTLGNATPTSDFDSCYISKDTIINGNTYYKMHRPGVAVIHPITYLRDSSTFIVNHHGNIMFSSSDFSNLFTVRYSIYPPNDTIYKTFERMTDKNLSISTSAGTFNTYNFQVTYEIWPSWEVYLSIINLNTRYAKGVGIITETMTMFITSSQYKERRLVRYHVN